jgi:hypothetical protein
MSTLESLYNKCKAVRVIGLTLAVSALLLIAFCFVYMIVSCIFKERVDRARSRLVDCLFAKRANAERPGVFYSRAAKTEATNI